MGIFSYELGKKDIIINWEYDSKSAIKLAKKIPALSALLHIHVYEKHNTFINRVENIQKCIWP